MKSPSQTKRAQTVLITGAARRIGKALALDFAARGWNVGVHYNSSRAPAEDVAAQIKALGSNSKALRADLNNLDEIEALMHGCVKALGPVDCLINNASIFEPDLPHTMDAKSWDTHLNVNLRAPVFLAQSFAAALPSDWRGNIINIVDQRVLNLSPDFFSYTIAKSALWAATQTLAQSLAPAIRVNAISPGPVLKSIHQTPEDFERERTTTLLGRGTSPREIASAIRFILDAPALTGQMITLDGGQHLTR